MHLVLLFSFLCSAVATLLVIASAHRHRKWSSDHDLSGPQKMHSHQVPRIGGVGLAIGIAGGAILLAWLRPTLAHAILMMSLCAAPTLVGGLAEDFTKAVRPRWRLLAPAISGLMGALLLQAVVVRTGWRFFDASLIYPVIALALTMLASSGIVNSFNIIDGMNGLASMCAALMLAGEAYVALRCSDALIVGLAVASIGAAMGFFVWNFPRGLIFLGDGGAYLLGLIVAELGLMLVYRNPAVSPLAPLMMVTYPVLETLFTMYRRKVIRGRPVSMPDGIHLHTLIYRRLMRWAVGSDGQTSLIRGNSLTSPFLWVLTALSVIPAALWWDSTEKLALSMLVFVGFYLRVYWQIVRLKTPRWMTWLGGRRG